MKAVTTYLHFDGTCRQAMTFYQQCFGAELQLNPYPDANGQPSAEPDARIMHSQLLLDGPAFLMASDGPLNASEMIQGTNFSVAVECSSMDEIERLFAAIGRNGKVWVSLTDVPWGARFGMLTDQFGTKWMFNYTLPPRNS